MSVNLYGCQSEIHTTAREPNKSEIEPEENDTLKLNDAISNVFISTSKGVNPTVFEKDKDIKMFKGIFSAAKKEPGDVNMANPEFFLEVIYTNENQESFYLWIGEKGQKNCHNENG
ncbi:hypothetical protein FIU87_08500 [Bacillus sp. THAF10]|uniref:hypothetical protein n=1 Tax=Bacillus sp. THAF10 TaxID=2587848 RepID=UPI001267FA5B|nr:hypothetical protein [Bacillus sp. THAF10]QFT88681.1 hypothetical protein FIU87_08500 [Bacillus sp. THAF10]